MGRASKTVLIDQISVPACVGHYWECTGEHWVPSFSHWPHDGKHDIQVLYKNYECRLCGAKQSDEVPYSARPLFVEDTNE